MLELKWRVLRDRTTFSRWNLAVISALAHCHLSEELTLVTGRQITAARALLGLTDKDLARLAQMSVEALQGIEAGSEHPGSHEPLLKAVRSALENAGITFIDERSTSTAGGVGLRLSAPRSSSIDTNAQETVQYSEMAENGPFGAGG